MTPLEGMRVFTEGERVHARIERVRTVVCSVKETLAEGHVGQKKFRMTEADIEVNLVVVPDSA